MRDDHVQASQSKSRLDHIVPEMEALSLGSKAGNSNPPLATRTSKENAVQNSSAPTVSHTEVGGESTKKRQVAADRPPTRPGLANQPTGKVHPEFWS